MNVSRRSTLVAAAVLALTGCSLPRWPVDAPISSDFGLRFRGLRPEIHRGVDMSVPTGTPVGSMASGIVRFAGAMRGFGNVIWVDHSAGVVTVYAHLSEIHVGTGEQIAAGHVIGLSGATGDVTAPHLHFEVWRWGRPVDPVPVLGGRPRK